MSGWSKDSVLRKEVPMTPRRRSELARKVDLRSWRDFPMMNLSLGTMLHNKTGSWRYIKPVYEDKVPACQNACPAGNDIEGWIKLLQRKEYERAYWHLKREQPFPAVLGRVCFSFCRTECNRAQLDASVGIKELERFIGDQVPLDTPHPDLPDLHGMSLAVVGSGPAGMSAAYFARLLGFRVTLFEALPEPGGILRVGIPAYRLPRHILTEEFQGLKHMGIEVRLHTPVGTAVSLDELCRSYDYLFLATGAHSSRRLNLAGEDQSPRIMSGLSMLKDVALGRKVDLGSRTAVVGGGNTAVDAARTAVRLGSQVTILYRRSEAEMPAHPEEIREALEEGVQLKTLIAPEAIRLDKDGTIRKLVCREMELGPPDESGRRRPVRKPGAPAIELEIDSIITAIGEIPVFDYLDGSEEAQKEILPVDPHLQTLHRRPGRARIFAGGDIIQSPHTVVHAVSSGKRAAIAMDCARKGIDPEDVWKDITIGEGPALSFSRYQGWAPVNHAPQNLRALVRPEGIVYDYFREAPEVGRDIQDPESRKRSFESHTRSFTPEEAEEEARRCLHCGRCTECDNCLIFCPDMSVLVRGLDRFGYEIDYDYCKGCGICVTECPRCAMAMVDEETPIQNS